MCWQRTCPFVWTCTFITMTGTLFTCCATPPANLHSKIVGYETELFGRFAFVVWYGALCCVHWVYWVYCLICVYISHVYVAPGAFSLSKFPISCSPLASQFDITDLCKSLYPSLFAFLHKLYTKWNGFSMSTCSRWNLRNLYFLSAIMLCKDGTPVSIMHRLMLVLLRTPSKHFNSLLKCFFLFRSFCLWIVSQN